MIVNINHNYVCSISGQKLSDQCSAIICNEHFISCDVETRNIIADAIKEYGSKTQQDMFLCYKGFDITREVRTYLTTVDIEQYKSTLAPLLEMPSELLIENGVYEWEVYKCLPEVYKHDPRFKNLFALLSKAIKNHRLTFLHGGGHTQYGQIIEQKNQYQYNGVYKLKCCAIFDRDTENDSSFDVQKNNHFKFFCNKNHQTMIHDDIYCLNQANGWTWHMWYKRAIENYFPKERYEEIGVSIGDDELSDYVNIGEKYKRYDKKMLPRLAEEMSRSMYERNLKRFNVNDVNMSEIQLLLLKFVKLV